MEPATTLGPQAESLLHWGLMHLPNHDCAGQQQQNSVQPRHRGSMEHPLPQWCGVYCIH